MLSIPTTKCIQKGPWVGKFTSRVGKFAAGSDHANAKLTQVGLFWFLILIFGDQHWSGEWCVVREGSKKIGENLYDHSRRTRIFALTMLYTSFFEL